MRTFFIVPFNSYYKHSQSGQVKAIYTHFINKTVDEAKMDFYKGLSPLQRALADVLLSEDKIEDLRRTFIEKLDGLVTYPDPGEV